MRRFVAWTILSVTGTFLTGCLVKLTLWDPWFVVLSILGLSVVMAICWALIEVIHESNPEAD